MLLLAICDADYCFTLFDIGQYECNSNSAVLANSQMGQLFEDDLLHRVIENNFGIFSAPFHIL